MESTEEIIALKRRVLQEAPYSAVQDKGTDKIFYMKDPGNDAVLSGTGTVSYKRGWGVPSVPTRYGGVLAADKALREAGYKPTNIFYPGNREWIEYMSQHRQAELKRKEQQKVFSPVELPKITKAVVQSETYYSRPINTNVDISMPPQMINRQMPQRRGLTYEALFSSLQDPVAEAREQKRTMASRIIDEQNFADMAYKSYGNVQRVASQLGVQGFGKVAKPKKGKKNNYNKNKKAGGVVDVFGF